jgi:drug/metabolite transporter (DMT)-like permease
MSPAGLLHLLVAALSYGVLHVLDRSAMLRGVDPAAYTIARVFIAMAILGASMRLHGTLPLLSVFQRDKIRDLAIIGVLASGLGLFLQIKGLAYSSATNVSVLLTLVAPLTALFALPILKEPISRTFLAAAGLMLSGVWLIYLGNRFSPFGSGDILVFLAMTGYAYSNVHARKTMKNIPTTLVTFGRLVFGSLSIALSPLLNDVIRQPLECAMAGHGGRRHLRSAHGVVL